MLPWPWIEDRCRGRWRNIVMDHIKVFASLVSLLLSLLALICLKYLAGQYKSPLFRFIQLLAAAYIVYECYSFGVYYTYVNILSIEQSPLTLTYKILWLVKAIILLMFRALLIKVSSILLGKELPFRLWRWFGIAGAGLIAFLLSWIALPGFHAGFDQATTVYRITLGAVDLTVLAIILYGSRLFPDHRKRLMLRSFVFLHLAGLAFFVLRWTVYHLPADSIFTRLVVEGVYPVYFNSIMPVWLWFFLRPWLKHSSSKDTIAGLTGHLGGMGLNPREQEIVNMMLLGKSNKDIAGTMFVSEHTVKNTITGIYGKLGVANRKELFHRFLARDVQSKSTEAGRPSRPPPFE